MINECNEQELQNKKRNLQANLSLLLNSKDCSIDKINELKSEILHIDKLIEKKVGSNELKRQEEVRRKKSGIDQANISTYNSLKSRYKKISEMNIATSRLISIIDNLKYSYEKSKVKG